VRRVFVILAIVLILVSPMMVSATTSRTLSVFHSDEAWIGFNPSRTIWSTLVNNRGFTLAEFQAYINHAQSQWARAGIHTFGVDDLPPASIQIFGGSRADLENMNAALRTRSALTVPVNWPMVGTHTFQHPTRGTLSIPNHRIDLMRVYVPRQPWYYLWWHADYYRTSFTHELGHALGWFGHSPNSQDVMHRSDGRRPVLTIRDIEHLRQNC